MHKPDNLVVMAFDYGNRRIGVAVGNTILKIAHPLITISGKNMRAQIQQIEELVNKWQPQLLLIGIPNNGVDLCGNESLDESSRSDKSLKNELINAINNFAKRMSKQFNLPYVLIGEDYSSTAAASMLNEQGIYGRDQSNAIDQLAACCIMQTYFATIG